MLLDSSVSRFWANSRESLSPHRMGSGEGGKKRPTVGRRKNLLWVGKTTYSRFYFWCARRRFLGGQESGSEDRVAFLSNYRDFLDGGSV